MKEVQSNTMLKGTVQIDETFIPVVEKDKVKKDGKQLRGVSRNQYCIGIGYDGTNVYAAVEGFGKTSQKKHGRHLDMLSTRDHILFITKKKLTMG